MNILVTGQSGAGKTTLFHQCRHDFNRESNLLIDLDNIGFRRGEDWIYPVNVVKELILSEFNDLICFGVSSNINEYIQLFDKVIVIYPQVDVPFIINFIKREEEKNQRLGYKPKSIYEKVRSLYYFDEFVANLNCSYDVVNFNDTLECLKKYATYLQLGGSK